MTIQHSEEALYRGAEIKTQIKLLLEEYDMIESQILEKIKILSAGMDKYSVKVGDYGTFSIVLYKTWTYPQSIQTKETELKELKKTFQADGTATAEESEVLKFNA